jgi:Fe-S cluster assembly iron-binding protein IscA
VLEDQEVTYTEEQIGESQSLQNAIANEWLMRIEVKQ